MVIWIIFTQCNSLHNNFSLFHYSVKYPCSFLLLCTAFLQPKFHFDLVFFFLSFSILLSVPYSYCFCWLWLSLCGCFVAKLEPAVSVSSSVQAPALAAPLPQGPLQVPQPSSLPLGLLTGICNCVDCESVRPGILLTTPPPLLSPFPLSAVFPTSVLGCHQYKKLTDYKIEPSQYLLLIH